MEGERHTPRQLFAVPLSDRHESQRKPTFSFGNEETLAIKKPVASPADILVLEAGESSGKSDHKINQVGEKTGTFNPLESELYSELILKQGNVPVD